MRDPNYAALPLHLGIEIRVPQKAPHERGDFILPDVCHNDAVASVPQARRKEVGVTGEKGSVTLPSQQNDNLLILQTLSAEIETDLSWRQPPRLEQQALSVQDVLVKNNQACAGWSTYSGAV